VAIIHAIVDALILTTVPSMDFTLTLALTRENMPKSAETSVTYR